VLEARTVTAVFPVKVEPVPPPPPHPVAKAVARAMHDARAELETSRGKERGDGYLMGDPPECAVKWLLEESGSSQTSTLWVCTPGAHPAQIFLSMKRGPILSDSI
jgi:hypothetical protein